MSVLWLCGVRWYCSHLENKKRKAVFEILDGKAPAEGAMGEINGRNSRYDYQTLSRLIRRGLHLGTYLIRSIPVGLLKKKPMNLKDQADLFIRVGELLDHGFTLMETLEFLKRLENKQQENIHHMIIKLQQGEPLYEVLTLQQFNHQVCMQIYFAEKHGLLSTAFTESGQYLIRKYNERKKLMKLLQYPIILLAVLIGVGFLSEYVLIATLSNIVWVHGV